MSSSFLEPKKPLDLNDDYMDWSKTVNETCLPLLRQSSASGSSSGSSSYVHSYRINLALRQIESYYNNLKHSAGKDLNSIHHLLFPSWRRALEMPIFFIGDIHPYLITNLVRSFNNKANQDSGEFASWKSPSNNLIQTINEAVKTISTNVTALMKRMITAQNDFVALFSEAWISPYHPQEQIQIKTVMLATASVTVDEAAKEVRNELMSIFLEANELRRSVIIDIVQAANEEQAALFLLRLLEILVGFQDQAPESQNNQRTLWIGDLKSDMNWRFLNRCFAHTEDVVYCKVIIDKQTGNSKGYGFIEFKSHDAAAKALQLYNNAPIPNILPMQRFRLNWSSKGSGYSIRVGDLSENVTSSMLREKFRGYRSVRNAYVSRDRTSGVSRRYGFVNFSEQSEQIRAVVEMNGVMCSTRPMEVSFARY